MTLLIRFSILSLIVVVIIGIGVGWVLDRNIERSILYEAAEDTADHVQRLIAPELHAQDFSASLSQERISELDRFFKEKVLSDRVVRVKLWNRQGLLVYSTEEELIGRQFPMHGHLEMALRGEIMAEISSLQEPEHEAERERFSQLIEIYSPVISHETGQIMGVYEIYQNPALVQSRLRSSRLALLSSLGLGFIVLYASLFTIVRQASRTLVQQNEELQQTLGKLREALGGIIQTVALMVETRDPYTAGHQRRTANLARAIASEMGLSEKQIDGIRMAGAIHDLGKISVPADLLSKPGGLSDLEYGMIKMHPQVSYDILKEIDFPWPVAQIVLQHHERLDGSGYPQGLSGKDILLEARILAVADVVEAMASHRPYRPARGIDMALEEISHNRGALYDAEVVDSCLKLFAEKGFKLEDDRGHPAGHMWEIPEYPPF